MIYAIIKEDDNGEIYGATFGNWREYQHYTFSSSRLVLFCCDTKRLKVCGKTREQKKDSAREIAVHWQYTIGDFCPSYMDFAIAGGYFTALGRKYGLLREFRENGIC